MINKKIGSIDFSILPPSAVREMSELRVVVPEIYDDAGYPVEGGLMDPKMGVVSPGLRCKTCGGRKDNCPGHFGHIELVRPVIHVGYAKRIYNMLRSTCRKCSKVLLEEDDIKEFEEGPLEGITLFRKVRDKAKKASECPHCGAEQKKIKFKRASATSYEEDGQRIRPSAVRERLERIPKEHLPVLNIDPDKNRPEWMILTVLPIPPVTTRPSITLESGNKAEDDLTHKLIDLLRINQKLAENLSAGAPQTIIEDLWDLLQYHVTTYINNKTSGIPAAKHRSGKPLNTLYQRIKGKGGRIKGELAGKRVNFSARSVISPDPWLSIGEVGVPQKIAEDITVPMKVTEKNLSKAKEYIENEEYPKAPYIRKPTGEKKKVTELNREDLLEEIGPGYEVERQLIDNDITIFNRQPSLHRLSMMAHRAKITPGRTIRINDGISKPYNADYDGDAMNLHFPQTIEAQVEARELLPVKENMLSPRHGMVLAGSQDHITGLAVMTTKGRTFTKRNALRLLKKVGIKRFPQGKEKEEYTGAEIVSELIPESITMEIDSNLSEEPVKIENGIIKEGTLDENTFGPGGELTREIWDREGPKEAEEFVDKIGKITLEALAVKGHTISIEDYELSEKANKERKDVIEKREENAEKYIDKFRKGKIEVFPGKTERETLEGRIKAEMAEINDETWEIAIDDLGTSNPGVIMTKSGARGSSQNIVQLTSTVGQMGVRGERLSRGYEGRILSHYEKGTLAPETKGYIPNSFIEGLEPDQLFQQAMSGRDSGTDKGIKTSASGYLQKRVVNAMLDLEVEEDLSVRNAEGEIIQFTFGEDGIETRKVRGESGINVDELIREVSE